MLTPAQIAVLTATSNEATFVPVARPQPTTVAFEARSDLNAVRLNVSGSKSPRDGKSGFFRLRTPVTRLVDGVETIASYIQTDVRTTADIEASAAEVAKHHEMVQALISHADVASVLNEGQAYV